jgi:hypothetical protein
MNIKIKMNIDTGTGTETDMDRNMDMDMKMDMDMDTDILLFCLVLLQSMYSRVQRQPTHRSNYSRPETCKLSLLPGG